MLSLKSTTVPAAAAAARAHAEHLSRMAELDAGDLSGQERG